MPPAANEMANLDTLPVEAYRTGKLADPSWPSGRDLCREDVTEIVASGRTLQRRYKHIARMVTVRADPCPNEASIRALLLVLAGYKQRRKALFLCHILCHGTFIIARRAAL